MALVFLLSVPFRQCSVHIPTLSNPSKWTLASSQLPSLPGKWGWPTQVATPPLPSTSFIPSFGAPQFESWQTNSIVWFIGKSIIPQLVENFFKFTEMEDSLPGSQQPTIFPYRKPDKSSQRLILFHWDTFYYYPHIHTYIFKMVFLLHVSLHTFLFSIRATCHNHHILFYLIARTIWATDSVVIARGC